MDVEVLIHGVPDGQDYFGIPEERTNAELYYENSPESVKFVVETKQSGNNAYAYYSYLRYRGMVGYGGRPGSYFGLTLRIDKYYQDVLHMYNMLEMVFKKYVIGSLLLQTGDSFKYLAPNFASKQAEIGQLQQGLIQLIQSSCVSSKFVDLDASFIHPITTAASCNISDITDNAMLASIKKYSKVLLSPEYKTKLSQEYDKKLQEAEGKGGALVAEKEKKLLEKESEISSLKSTISSLKTTIESLRDGIRQKDSEIIQYKKNGELSKLVASVKDPIGKLADYFRVQDSQRKPAVPSYGRKNYLIGIVGSALSLVILVLFVLFLIRNPQKVDAEPLEKQIAELTQENDQLKQEILLKEATIEDLRAQLDSKTMEPPPVSTTTPVNLKIDVTGYSKGQPLLTDQEYTITIKDGNNKYNGKGKWLLTNAVIKKGNESDAQITIQPTGKGKVVLDYKSDNCTCASREFQIKEPSINTQNSNMGGNKGGSGETQDKQGSIISFDIIIDPKVTEVEMDKTYTFSVSGYDGKGVWGVDGFSAPDDKKTNAITVKVINTGGSNTEATISYTPEGGEKKKKTFKIKTNE